MPKIVYPGLALIVGAALAACAGGSASSSPTPAAKASAPAAASTGAAAKPSGAAAAPPSAAVVGPKAPGPYSFAGSAAASGGNVPVEATDTLKWQPNTITAKAGDKVTLDVKNAGSTAHTFISPGLNVATGVDVPTGKTTSVSFTAPTAPGAYQFWCNIPGHAEAGMVGEVIVQ